MFRNNIDVKYKIKGMTESINSINHKYTNQTKNLIIP